MVIGANVVVTGAKCRGYQRQPSNASACPTKTYTLDFSLIRLMILTRSGAFNRSGPFRPYTRPMTTTAAMDNLPANIPVERIVLGSILINDALYDQVAGTLDITDFDYDGHQRIFKRMGDLYSRNERIDRLTVANELIRFNELEACGGLGYLVSLDDGMPQFPNIDSYIKIVKDKSLYRRLIFLTDNMRTCALLERDSAEEILAAAEASLLKLSESRVRPPSFTSCGLSASMIEMAESRAQQYRASGKPVMGIESGFRGWDEILSGFNPGLHLLAGGPGVGKTSLSLQISINACLHGTPVCYVSYENSPKNLILKAICTRAGLVARDIERGVGTAEQLRKFRVASEELQPAFTRLEIIEGNMSLQLAEIRARALKAQRDQCSPCLVVFDYLQRAAPAQGQKEARMNVSALAGHLRDLATRLDCPVLAISSQNRAEGNYGTGRGSASLTSLKESGDLEYAADSVSFLHKSEQRMTTPPAIAVDLTVSKNRFGPEGSVHLIFRGNVGAFREEAHEAAAAGRG